MQKRKEMSLHIVLSAGSGILHFPPGAHLDAQRLLLVLGHSAAQSTNQTP